MKMILKECVDEGGCKGGGSVHEISRLVENFQRSIMEFVMESFEVKIFQKNRTDNSQFQEKDIS